MYSLTDDEYKTLRRRSEWLGFLESAGVDNWLGIDYAYELADEAGYNEEDD